MSLFCRVVPNLVTNIQRTCLFPTIQTTATHVKNEVAPGGIFTSFIRNHIIDCFPRASERKRIKKHGFKKRMSTESQRKILMRRILKGRHVLCH